jgi:hypothetical protein
MIPKNLFLICSLCLSALSLLNAEDWLMHYYLDPTPDLLPQEVKKLTDQGIFEQDNSKWPAIAFLSEVMAANPEKIEVWMTELESQDQATVDALQFAAWCSYTEAAQDYFTNKKLNKYLENEAPRISEMEVNNPTVLDMLWAQFFATGNAAPLKRIATALELSKYATAVDDYKNSEKTVTDQTKLQLGITFRAAMWSIGANCKNHPLVIQHYKEIFKDPNTPKSQSLWIGVILSKVDPENFSIQTSNLNEGPVKVRSHATQLTKPGWQKNGTPMPDSDNMKSKDGFGVQMWVIDDEAFFEDWKKPAPPKLPITKTVKRNETVYIIFPFINPGHDDASQANVSADMTILAPNGETYGEFTDIEIWQDVYNTPQNNIQLGVSHLGLVIEDNDLLGTYIIEAKVTDKIKHVTLNLHTEFTAVDAENTAPQTNF